MLDRMNHRSLIGHLESWAGKYKLRKLDFTITGVDACILHGLCDQDTTELVVLAKRKVFNKFTTATGFDYKMFNVNDKIRIIQDDESRDTVIINGCKTLSLQQIILELNGIRGLEFIVDKAKEMLGDRESAETVEQITNGLNGREQFVRRLRKQKKFLDRRPHQTYRRR